MADKKTNASVHLKEVEEGPYYKADSPARTSITHENTPGEKLILSGRVLDSNGNPVSGAWLDFWQADGKGLYDNSGYMLRGHQYTDEKGIFQLETVIPGPYGNRAPHVHLKVKTREFRTFTTQLFFKNHPSNLSDPVFEQTNVMDVTDTPEGKHAKFDIILTIE